MRIGFALLLVLMTAPLGAQQTNGTRLRVADEGTTLASRPVLNFVGTTVSCAVDGARITCTFTGGSGHTIQDEGSSLTARTNLNFTGAGITCTDDAANDQTDCDVPQGGVNDATYITQTSNATLTNEQALSGLATGYMKVANGTGVVSSQAVPIPIADGGTNGTTATAAFDNLAPTTTKGDLIVHNGTDNIRLPVTANNGWFLMARSSATAGVEWAPAIISQIKTDGDQTLTNTTALSTITGLGAVVTATGYAILDCFIIFSGNTATDGIRLSWNVSVAFTSGTGRATIPIAADGTDSAYEGWITASDDPVVGTDLPAINTKYIARLYGMFYNAAGSGTVLPRFSNEVAVAGNSITVYNGSMCFVSSA